MCRSSTQSAQSVGEIYVEDGNLMFSWTGGDEDAGTVENVAMGDSEEVVGLLAYSNRNHDIQTQRALVNRAVRAYRKHETQAMQARSELIRESLETLRDLYRSDHQKLLRRVKRELRSLRRIEMCILGRASFETLAASYPQRYVAENILGREESHFGPLKHRFWHH
jgi:hypothetical protein